ncbi:WecB/TagA/CpsF family glycosyltransferase [Albidovulum sediminicola]|uniref:WecB/TagA/CpsF family glycosyltransferase n=1 Tax=Albidovulum sediminicola TaxID=2984331 RepID=A0ABT2YYW9_9RHOB|nr:WecB/TagA/CpsF family glycosyltransferase [Defluviimonas sp. WL0075]MCV2864051.1 WecB/TagA/CpsF family glycosyltransferase [Defluviimonas sp. WL0075]
MDQALRHGLAEGEFLGAPFHRVDMDRALALANRAMRDHQRLQHCDINVAKIIQMRSDPDLARYVRESDIVCIDGAGVMLGCRVLGIPTGGRVTGVDLMMRTLDLCEHAGFRPYFFGARQEVVEAVAERLAKTHPNLKLAGYRNGYFRKEDEAAIVAEIRASGADCLFVGITSPIKERFLFEHRDALGVPFQLGVGGALDVLAGKVRRAPRFVQAIGMEWLFRVLQEPRRLFWRYLSTNTRFGMLLLGALLRKCLRPDRNDQNGQRPPAS